MASRSYYSNMQKTKRAPGKIAVIVLTAILVIAVGFIGWSAISFGNNSGYVGQAQEITELKIQIAEKDAQIAELTKQNEDLRIELETAVAGLSAEGALPEVTESPLPSESPVPSAPAVAPVIKPAATPVKTQAPAPTVTPPPSEPITQDPEINIEVPPEQPVQEQTITVPDGAATI